MSTWSTTAARPSFSTLRHDAFQPPLGLVIDLAFSAGRERVHGFDASEKPRWKRSFDPGSEPGEAKGARANGVGGEGQGTGLNIAPPVKPRPVRGRVLSPRYFALHPFSRRTGFLHIGFRLSSLLRFITDFVILSSRNPSAVLFSASCTLSGHRLSPISLLPKKRRREEIGGAWLLAFQQRSLPPTVSQQRTTPPKADCDGRVRTRAYSAAVLAVELALASAQSPALTARQKVRLLGKQQVDPGRRPTDGLRTLHRAGHKLWRWAFSATSHLKKGKHPGHQKQSGPEADKQPLAARTEPGHRKKRAHW